MHHGIEMILQVDALTKAIGADEHMLRCLAKLLNALRALYWRQCAGDGGYLNVLRESLAQFLRDVFGGVDEAAEDDRTKAVFEDRFQQVARFQYLPVLFTAQRIRDTRHFQETATLVFRIVFLSISSRGDINTFLGFSLAEIEDRAAADFVSFLGRLCIRRCSPTPQSRGRSCWAAGKSAKQGERRPPPNTLMKPAAALVRDHLAGIAQHSVEKLLVLLRKLITFLLVVAFRKQRIGIEIMADVNTPTLDKLCGQPAPVLLNLRADQIVREIVELRIEYRKQRAKRAFIPAMRSCCNQNEVAAFVRCEFLHQLMTLVTSTTAFLTKCASVGFIDDHHFRACPEKIVPAAIGFDEIRRDNDMWVKLEKRLMQAAVTFEPSDCTREYEFGVYVEFFPQLRLPLLGKVRRAEYREALHFAAIQKLARDERRFNCFSNADVVRDKQTDRVELECH